MENLKRLKLYLREWNKDILSKEVCKKREILSRIDHIDRLEEQSNIQNFEVEDRKRLKAKLMQLTVNEQRCLSQKSKIKWLREGDENTNLFHTWTTARKNRAFISILEDDTGNILSSEAEIENEILSFYKKVI